MDRLRGSRRRSPAAGRGLDGFLLALGQSTLSGDVIPVVLRHAADLLGASAASLDARAAATDSPVKDIVRPDRRPPARPWSDVVRARG